jgi:hypothetical protein
MLGTFASFMTNHLAAVMPGELPSIKLTYAAAAVGFGIYALALMLSTRLPEPPETLPD